MQIWDRSCISSSRNAYTKSEPCVCLCRLRVPPGSVLYIHLLCTCTNNISTDVEMSLTCTQKVEGKSADLHLSFILFSRISYTNSGSFGKCVVYSPLLYVVLHKRNIIITTTDSTPNVSTNCHATTTSRVRLTNTMSFFLNQSVESEQEQKYVLSRQTFQADIMLLIDFQK